MDKKHATRNANMSLFYKKHAHALILFLVLWVSLAYFHHRQAGWNVNSRLALTYAVVEQGTVAIDAYHDNPFMPYLSTNDKAVFDGHFYSDKSPALSFSAVPLYAALYHARESLGLGEKWTQERWVLRTRYLVRIATVTLAAALLGVILFLTAIRFGLSRRMSALLAIGLIWGTMLAPYGTLFYSYLPATAALALAWLLLLRARQDARPIDQGGILFTVGILLGIAWFLEFTTGLAGIGIAAYAAWATRKKPLALWKMIIAGLIPVAIMFAYCKMIFGEFSIPYKYEYDEFFRQQMAQGFQGIHLPRLSVLYFITIHPFRGLFVHSPFLLLWFAGIIIGLRRTNRTHLPDLLLSVYIVLAYFAFASGYYMWWGGWAAGTRHLIPALPFFLFPITLFIKGGNCWKTTPFLLLLVFSVSVHFMVTAHNPQIPAFVPQEILLDVQLSDQLPSPVFDEAIPRFLNGQMALNLGMKLGLSGRWSLAPFLLLTTLASLWFWRNTKQ